MVNIGNGISVDGPISGAQATAPGQAPMLDESMMIPEAFIPKSATGGGTSGHWESIGNPGQSYQWVAGDTYRIWTPYGCEMFRYRSSPYSGFTGIVLVYTSQYVVYDWVAGEVGEVEVLGDMPWSRLDDNLWEVEHWVPDE